MAASYPWGGDVSARRRRGVTPAQVIGHDDDNIRLLGRERQSAIRLFHPAGSYQIGEVQARSWMTGE